MSYAHNYLISPPRQHSPRFFLRSSTTADELPVTFRMCGPPFPNLGQFNVLKSRGFDRFSVVKAPIASRTFCP